MGYQLGAMSRSLDITQVLLLGVYRWIRDVVKSHDSYASRLTFESHVHKLRHSRASVLLTREPVHKLQVHEHPRKNKGSTV